MMKATFVKKMEGWRGDARLYQLSHPVSYDGGSTNHVVVSATHVVLSGPETYAFPSDDRGKVLDWGELDGSERGIIDHGSVLRAMGYEVEDDRDVREMSTVELAGMLEDL